MQLRKQLDEMTKSQRAEDFIKHKEILDRKYQEIVAETLIQNSRAEKRRNIPANEVKRQAIDYVNAQTEKTQTEKALDHQLVRNLQEHDERQMVLERERKKALQRDLKETLTEQIREKEADRVFVQSFPRATETAASRVRVQAPIEDDGFGTNDGRGFTNLDQRPAIEATQRIRNSSVSRERQNDQQLVTALSE